MNEQLFYISELIQKRLRGDITSEEEADLLAWADRSAANKSLLNEITSEAYIRAGLEKMESYDLERSRALLHQVLNDRVAQTAITEKKASRIAIYRKLWRGVAVAASIIGVALLVKFLVLTDNDNDSGSSNLSAVINDVKAPERNKAAIRLANGQILYLDSATNGTLAEEKGASIIKSDDGKIAYKLDDSNLNPSRQLVYNTLTNPKGSKVIDMQLSDGSHVWLNAGSSISFPVSFIGAERKVVATGEAYFEVAKDVSKPFIVSTEGIDVKVLGTHFNVNSFEDERTSNITLLEGSVQVEKNGVRAMLKPGEQAQLNKSGQIQVDDKVNIEAVMAWKNGSFYFEGSDIQTILRQVSRWYDVEIVFEGAIPDGHYVGRPSRTLSLSQMLKVIEYSGVRFRVEGKKLVIIN